MRAFVVKSDVTNRFEEVDRPEPELGPRDLLVEVKAVSLNPVDTKVRGVFRLQGDHEATPVPAM